MEPGEILLDLSTVTGAAGMLQCIALWQVTWSPVSFAIVPPSLDPISFHLWLNTRGELGGEGSRSVAALRRVRRLFW